MSQDNVRKRPRILFVTSHWPQAAAYGAQQRVLNLGRLLSRFGDVSFVLVPTEVEDQETLLRTEREFEVRKIIRPFQASSEKLFDRVAHSLRNQLDPTYMATDPYEVSESDRVDLEELIEQHDVVWVHTIRTAHWFRIYRWPHSVLDVDDLPSRMYWSTAHSGSSPLRRMRDVRMAWIWERRERLFPERFDVLTVCSEADRRYLGKPDRIHVIPNGASLLARSHRNLSGAPRIGFIGNCTYMPNEDGIKWFIRHVWPRIKREFPGAELRLVGRGSQDYLTKLGPDIVGRGWLENPEDEIASWSAMIVPIRVGGGTRVKVADGFARRCPVVATTMGAFGYDVENARELLLADRADDFASACLQLMKDPELGGAISERAHQRFLERWRWDSFESTVGKVVQECLARSNRVHLDQAVSAL